MSAQELLERANRAGLNIVADGDRLRVRGPRKSADLAKLLIQNKGEIIAILTAAAPVKTDPQPVAGDETPVFSENGEVSSPLAQQSQYSEPPTPDQIRFWLDCLRESGCQVALVEGAPSIRWGAGIATAGRLQDWQANLDTIAAVLEADEERLAIQEEANGDSEQKSRS
jgi:hypothetical protein